MKSLKLKFKSMHHTDNVININTLPPYLVKYLENANTRDVKTKKLDHYITKPEANLKPIIKVDHVSKAFSRLNTRHDVLKGISFTINEGEHLALLGANGAGKTTLLNIIVGLLKPDSGCVKYLYQNNNYKEIGMQFQDSSYPKGITTKNVIDFMLDIYKLKINQNELNAIIEIFGITDFLYKNASALSGGQQQRINAMLAIIHKPKIVFLDELSAGLDLLSKKKITKFILDFCNAHKMTLCIVSHDLLEIEYFSKRIVLLSSGNIIVDAKKYEIITKFKSLENFISLYIK